VNEERRRILNMLSEGKISAEDADNLLDVLQEQQPRAAAVSLATVATAAAPKYLRVLVEGQEAGHNNKVNVRVPLDLIRAGMRLAALLPAVAYEPVNRALKENGLDLDVSKIKPENLEELVAHLQELSVDVEGGGDKVRVFCE
jgi:membrane peptidoglycan carboxypeptidase